MDLEKIISELVTAPKYQQRADVREVVDVAVAELREASSKTKIKEVLDGLKEKLAATLNPASTSNTEKPTPEFETFLDMASVKTIDGLDLSSQAKEKLKKMFEGYKESVATAKEVDPTVETKPMAKVVAGFLKLGLPKIREIAEFGRPTLIVTPKNSFEEKLANMNKKKKYIDADGNAQEDVYVWNDASGPYQNIGTPAKTVISVVDGQPHMPHIPGITPNSRWDDRKAAFKAHFAKKGLRLINVHEAAVLEQRSLREYEANSKDVTKIVDYYQTGQDTVSCLDDEYLTNSSFVACSYFDAGARRVSFSGSNPGNTVANLRARPSVQVLEY